MEISKKRCQFGELERMEDYVIMSNLISHGDIFFFFKFNLGIRKISFLMYFNLRGRVWKRFNYISVSTFLLTSNLVTNFLCEQRRGIRRRSKINCYTLPTTTCIRRNWVHVRCVSWRVNMIFNIFAIPQREPVM